MVSLFCHGTGLHDNGVASIVKHFSDGETFIQVPCNDVRDQDVIIYQSLSSPVNESIMELILTIDAVKNCKPKHVFLAVSYLGYARQDRIIPEGSAFSSRVIAQMLSSSGVDGILVLDAHSQASIEHFTTPFIDLKWDVERIIKNISNGRDVILCSTDAGGISKIQNLASHLGCETLYTQKHRPEPGKSMVMGIVGNPSGKIAILIDDIIDSAGTLCNAADAIAKAGAKEVHAIATHGIFSGSAFANISSSVIQSITITNSIPQKHGHVKINVVDVYSAIHDAIMANFIK